ncbi:MAG: serine/threonine-protein kinase [Planctomycetota bacterium]|jgi:serine/threonine protein kinase
MANELDVGRRSVIQWVDSKTTEEEKRDFELAPDKYSIDAEIGKGGMGEVMLVTDRDLRRQVAMKIIRPDVAESRDLLMHFVAEAQATSQLEHPGIPPVHDIGFTQDNQIYFTMKLVRGQSMRDVIQDLVVKRRGVQEEFNLHRLVSMLQQIAETLHFAHERGVLHRDIKPDNIMQGWRRSTGWSRERCSTWPPSRPSGRRRPSTAGRTSSLWAASSTRCSA